MSIEQSFRDDKSGGFDLEHTRLRPQNGSIVFYWQQPLLRFGVMNSESLFSSKEMMFVAKLIHRFVARSACFNLAYAG
jgi:hypothetical protein